MCTEENLPHELHGDFLYYNDPTSCIYVLVLLVCYCSNKSQASEHNFGYKKELTLNYIDLKNKTIMTHNDIYSVMSIRVCVVRPDVLLNPFPNSWHLSIFLTVSPITIMAAVVGRV